MPAQNPIKRSHELLLTKLAALFPPTITVSPEPEEFEAVRTYLEDMARIIDAHILIVGEQVKSNSGCNISLGCFTNTLTDALEGWALYEIGREVEALKEDRAA